MAFQALIRNVLILKSSFPRSLTHLRESSPSSLKNVVKHFSNTSVKNFYEDYFKLTQKGSEKLRLSDGVPAGYKLIYRTPVENFLKLGYPVLLFCSVSGPLFVLYQYYVKGRRLQNIPTETVDNRIIHFINPQYEVFLYVGVMFVLAAATFSVMFKTPYRIYKHQTEHKYIATYLNCIPVKVKQFHFETASQTAFKNPLYFFCKEYQFLIGKRKAILFDYYFRKPADIFDMIGMD